jgi:FtsP/CotA-like multicopper oxidase with cupredoxin domain
MNAETPDQESDSSESEPKPEEFLIHIKMANNISYLPNFNQYPDALRNYSGYQAAILRYKPFFGFRVQKLNLNGATEEEPGTGPIEIWPQDGTPEEQLDFLLRNPKALRPNQEVGLSSSTVGPILNPVSLSRSKRQTPDENVGGFTDYTIEVASSPFEATQNSRFQERVGRSFRNNSLNFQEWNVLNEKDLQPHDQIPAPRYVDKEFNLSIIFDTDPGTGRTYVTFNGNRYSASEKPLIFRMLNRNDFIPKSFGIMPIELGDVVQVKITNGNGTPHPFHLHGHTFWVVGREPVGGTPTWFPTGVRRDTAVVDAAQSIYIKFIADNPGAWLLHCHINWHHQAGLAANFVEAPKEAKKMYRNIPTSVRTLCTDSKININTPSQPPLFGIIPSGPSVSPVFPFPLPQ